MKKPLITTLIAATVASAILAAPAGAGKPVYSATCVIGPGGLTTLTWLSGTTRAHVIWRDLNSTPVDEALVTVTTHGPDSAVVNTPPAILAGWSANVTFDGRKLPNFAVGVCAPPPPA
jgi:hypothetical protein